MIRTSFIQTMTLVLVGISLLVGCTRPSAIREQNRDNLSRLSIDMNRKEVLQIMRKPYRTELMRMPKGETLLRRYRAEQHPQRSGKPQGGVQDIREQVGSGDPMY